MCLQVKIQSWIDGKEDEEYNGMTAKFSSDLPDNADPTTKVPAVISDPLDCCSASTVKVSFSFPFLRIMHQLFSPTLFVFLLSCSYFEICSSYISFLK